MKKVTRNEINKENMVAFSYCQCQTVLNLFAYDYKIGCNTGIYGWNYDLYRINGIDVVAGYNVPFYNYSNGAIKKKLITLENEIRKDFDYSKSKEYEERFFKIFE